MGLAPDRVRGALQEMGVSILSGCCTTWIACIALYCCEFSWFKLFGCFVTMVIWSSFFVTMTGVTAVLSLYGPTSLEDGKIILPEFFQRVEASKGEVEGERRLERESRRGSFRIEGGRGEFQGRWR